MTLCGAIVHALEVAHTCDGECGREHQQIAEWLGELVELRDETSRQRDEIELMRKALEQRHSEMWAYKRQVTDGVMREVKLEHLVETLWKVVYCNADDPYAYVDMLRQATDTSLDLGIDPSRRNDA